jgi:hypothetical protein
MNLKPAGLLTNYLQTTFPTIINNPVIMELWRKSLHISICIFFYLLLLFFHDTYLVIAFFSFGLIAILIFRSLGLIDVLQKVNRISSGHYFMYAGILLLYLLHSYYRNNAALTLAMMGLGIADTLAVFGKPVYNWLIQNPLFTFIKRLTYGGKTITGSLIFFSVMLISSLIVNFAFQLNLTPTQWLKLSAGLLIITVTEFWAIFGIDNLFIPILGYLTLIYNLEL